MTQCNGSASLLEEITGYMNSKYKKQLKFKKNGGAIRNMYKLSGVLAMVLGVFVLLPLRADAYIDPNTGGVFFNS